MKIKVCGITNIEDALACVENGADMLGFIFYEKSKRYIDFKTAEKIISQLSSSILKVGVFVNEDFNIVNFASAKLNLEAVQLHGHESPEYIGKINSPVFKAFRIKEKFDWGLIDSYKNCTPLLDSYSENLLGGTGKSFDWNSIPKNYRSKIILSGGITIEKLDKIFNEIKPAAIDVSSSLESEPGKKDHKKVKEFLTKFNQLRSRQC